MSLNPNFTIVNGTVLYSIESGFYIFNVPANITELYDDAFRASCETLTTINFLSDKVVSIGEYCIAYCYKLVNFNLSQCPNLQTVKSFAFIQIQTPSFYIPSKSLISFGGYQLSLISEFIVPKDHIEYIAEDGIIYNKNKTILYASPPEKKGAIFEVSSQVEIIYSLAFATSVYMNYISFPKSLTQIQNYCFALSSLFEVIIPETVISIGVNAFERCKLLKLVQFHCCLESIPKFIFYNCINLVKVIVIGNPKIASDSFEGCTSLCEIYSTKEIQSQILNQIPSHHCQTPHCIKYNSSSFHVFLSYIFILL